MFKKLKPIQIIFLMLFLILSSICLFGIIRGRTISTNNKSFDSTTNQKLWALCMNADGPASEQKINREIYTLVKFRFGDVQRLIQDEGLITFPDKDYPLLLSEVEDAEAILCVQIEEKPNNETICEYSGGIKIPLRGIQTQFVLVTNPGGDLIARYSFDNDAGKGSCPVKIMCSTASECSGIVFHEKARPGNWLDQYLVP